MIRGVSRYICVFSFFLLVSNCSASKGKRVTSLSANTYPKSIDALLAKSIESSRLSMKNKDRGDAKKFAKNGMKYARHCIIISPDDMACHYWNAVNTGLYYKIHIIGYQKGIRSMIADCDLVIKTKPKYEHAGAHRMLAEIYAQLPRTGIHPNSITRNLDLAEKYARTAVNIDSAYPENQLILAQILTKKESNREAFQALSKAKTKLHNWKTDLSYKDWNKSIRRLEKKLAGTYPQNSIRSGTL